MDPAATGSHSNHPLEPAFPEYTRTNRVQLQSEMQADSSVQLTGVIQGGTCSRFSFHTTNSASVTVHYMKGCWSCIDLDITGCMGICGEEDFSGDPGCCFQFWVHYAG